MACDNQVLVAWHPDPSVTSVDVLQTSLGCRSITEDDSCLIVQFEREREIECNASFLCDVRDKLSPNSYLVTLVYLRP